MITVEKIYRYPVKGFPGEKLKVIDLSTGKGMPGDRAIALGIDSVPASNTGEWAPCQTFLRMTIQPELTTFKIGRDGGNLQLTSPKGDTHVFAKKNAKSNTLQQVLGSQVVAHHASHSRGYWDHADAAISIINLSTIETIAKLIDKPIDPLRFRANLYIRSEPWSEFGWLGQNLKIGSASLDIIRPIDRCKTTSVNVDTGKVDLNIPAVLMRHYGHHFCGVYASVTTSGKVELGANMILEKKLTVCKLKESSKQKTVPHLTRWPRPATVIDIKPEADKIKSFWIQDPLSKIGSLDGFKPGQYLCLHNLSEKHTWRSYTISAIKDGKLRITVKRDSGVGSQAIHQWRENEKVIITGPFGNATVDSKSNAIHFISAGIGITPTVAKLSALARESFQKPVQVTHVARSSKELALWSDVLAASKKLSKAAVELYLTIENDIEGAVTGRPDTGMLANKANLSDADVHICGPKEFTYNIIGALEKIGICDSKIFIDTFSSPNIDTQMNSISRSGPIKVTLARSGISDYWNPTDGTLLDFAEARGAIIPSHCRAGICNTCTCKVLNGSVTQLNGLAGDEEVTALLCSTIPKSSLTLDI